MVVSARRAAADILSSIDKKDSYGNLELKNYLGRYTLSPLDRSLAAELVYGVLRYRLTLDWALGLFLKRKGIKGMKPPLRAVLRSGAYQILYLEKIPAAAACDEGVKLAKELGFSGLAGLVNGVLRNLARNQNSLPWPAAGGDPVNYLSLTYSHPPWMLKRWLQRFSPEEAEKLLRANNTPPPLSLRVNTLRTGVKKLQEELEEEGLLTRAGLLPETLLVVENRGDLTASRGFQAGLFSIQGEVSALAARLLNPEPGELVVDLCSAPGGKTTHLAQLMGDRGQVIAGDFHPHRRKLVEAAAGRLGLKSIDARVWDARSLPRELRGKAHRVLLDAPCSGLGVIRRKPDLKWQRQPGDFAPLAALQEEMLGEGVKLLGREGRLLYSVCTNEPEETGDLLSAFLKKSPRLESLPLKESLPPGLKAWPEGPGIHIYPHMTHTDGFYFALLRQKP